MRQTRPISTNSVSVKAFNKNMLVLKVNVKITLIKLIVNKIVLTQNYENKNRRYDIINKCRGCADDKDFKCDQIIYLKLALFLVIFGCLIFVGAFLIFVFGLAIFLIFLSVLVLIFSFFIFGLLFLLFLLLLFLWRRLGLWGAATAASAFCIFFKIVYYITPNAYVFFDLKLCSNTDLEEESRRRTIGRVCSFHTGK